MITRLCVNQSLRIRLATLAISVGMTASAALAQTTVPLGVTFNEPRGIAIDSAGNLFVADGAGAGDSSAIHELLAPDYTTAITIAGSDTSQQFVQIYGMAFDSDDNLFVADQQKGIVYEIQKQGGAYNNVVLLDNGDFLDPTGLALDSAGNLFVSDKGNGGIFEMTKASGYSTSSLSQIQPVFDQPFGIAFDRDDNLFIAESNGAQVQKATKASNYAAASVLPTSNVSYQTPAGLALFPDGTLVVIDQADPGVIYQIAGPSYGSAVTLDSNDTPNRLHAPSFVTIDRSGNVFVADTLNNVIRELQTGVTVTAVSPGAGLDTGGAQVTITGTNFTSDATVSFGGIAANGFTVNSDSSITVLTPPLPPGTVDITVTTGAGTSATVVADQFTYMIAPTVTTLNASPSPATFPQSETLTAQVASSGGTVNGGTVRFADGGTAIQGCDTALVTAGMATCSIALSAGNHSLAASYSGNTTFDVSSASGVSEQVNPAVAATLLNASLTLTEGSGPLTVTPVTGSGGTGTLSYSIAPFPPTGLNFSASTGSLFGTPSVTLTTTSFTVTVTDANNQTAQNSFLLAINPPVATTQAIPVKQLTQSQTGVSFTPVTASGGTAPLTYSLSPTTLPSGLSFDTSTGTVSGNANASFAAQSYTVTVQDFNFSQSSSNFSLSVVTPPVTVLQSAAVGLTVGRAANVTPVTAHGGTGTLTFTAPALGDGLAIDATTGAITGTPTDTLAGTAIMVTATDANGVQSSKSFTLTVNAAVSAPVAGSPFTLTQGQPSATITQPVRFFGGTTPFIYSVSPPLPAGLTLGTTSGDITGSPTATQAAANFAVTATDANGSSATNTVNLTVNSAVTIGASTSSLTWTQNHFAAFTPATGQGGTIPLRYSVAPALPTGLSIDSSTGSISGTPSGTAAAANFTVTVTDANLGQASSSFSLTVNPAVTATTNLPTVTLTQNQGSTSFTPVAGGGGTVPLSYSISPSLPAGLSINASTGTISGSPTGAVAATNFTVTVTDAVNATASSTFFLKANAQPTATQSIPSETLTQNQLVRFTPVTGSNGTPSLVYSVNPGLPAGLTINPSTGTISGTPSVTHAASIFGVTVTDSNGVTASNTFSLTINAQVTATVTTATEGLTQGRLASFIPVTGGGGTGTLGYGVAPTLPAGLSISPTTGTISGTPSGTLAATSFTVTVTDGNGATASNPFQLAINAPVTAPTGGPAVTLTQNRLATGFAPVTSFTGGTTPYSYSINPTLPAGLSISPSNGAISGTPSVSSTQTSFTVTATDVNGSSAGNSFLLTVNAPVATAVAMASENLTQGHLASFTPVTETGGTSPLTFTISPTLPAGLSIAPGTGIVSGTPSGTLTATGFTVTAADSLGSNSSSSFTLTVNPTVTATPSVPSKILTQGRMASFVPVTGGGGTGPLGYSIGAALPTGLSFDAATGTVSGTPGGPLAQTSFTVTVTDANGVTASNSFQLTIDAPVTAPSGGAAQALTQNRLAVPFTPVTSFTGGVTPYTYGISPTLPTGLSLDPASGVLSGTATGTLTQTNFTVTATDVNGSSAGNSFALTVNPAVTTTLATATKILTQNHLVTAFTPVTGANGTGALTFGISPTLPAGLTFDPTSGAIGGTPSASAASANYTVTATDTLGSSSAKAFALAVDTPPTATQAIPSEALTQSHAANFTPVTGANGAPTLAYSISPPLPAGLSIDPGTGAISGTPSGTLAATSFTVTVTDANGVTATNSFSLTINSAVTASVALATESLTQGRLAGFTPITGGGGTGTLSYGVAPALPAGLSISASTGAISGTPSSTVAATSFTVTVTDGNGATASNPFQLTVNAAPTATVAVPVADLTQSHDTTPFAPVTGTGGTPPYRYSVAPSLPAGLSIDSTTGAVTGKPTAPFAQASLTVTVTDANGATATGSFSLTVSGAPTATQIIATKGLTATVMAAPFTPVTGSGGAGTLHYSVAPALPAGLSLDSTTGTITGEASATAPAATYTVTVTDANGATAAASFALAINGPLTATTAVATTSLTQGHAATPFTPVTGSGGTTPLTYSVAPALPAGLTYGTSSGAVSGTASATSPATDYAVTVTDANGATANANFSLAVNPPVTATSAVPTTSLRVNQAATPFTPVTGAGGTGALVYSVAPSLPAGLSLASATGAISGTPTAALAATGFTVTVTDTNGATGSAGFSLAVTSAATSVAITSSANPSSLGQAVTFTAAVSGNGGTPTGTVLFKDGAATLFTGTLANGLASYTTSTLSPGTHAITVAYGGDALFASSAGALAQQVSGGDTVPGQTYPFQSGLPGFGRPGQSAWDNVSGHVLVVDTGNQQVRVLDGATLAQIAILGTMGAAGSDNAHFANPIGVAFDPARNQILVADTGNNRLQVFDAAHFAYVETIAGFNAPSGVYADAGRLYVADTGNQQVQILDATSRAAIGALGTSGAVGADTAHFNAPSAATVNAAVHEILVADTGNGRVQRFDTGTLAYKGTLGGTGPIAGTSGYLGQPVAIAYDATSNLVLIADAAEQRVEVFDALSYTYALTLGRTGQAGSGTNQFSAPAGIAIDPADRHLFVSDRQNDRVQIFGIAPTVTFASVLPGSRSVALGTPATIFATMINAGTTPLQGCQLVLPVTVPQGLALSYQTTDPATNALTGTQDTPATIAANNGVQSFLVTLTGTQAFSAPGMALDFTCLGTAPAAVATGVDTVDLAMSATPVADVIALAATASNDGIARIPAGGASAFAVASSNVGATAQLVVSVDTGSASLPLTATLCQSNPATGACLATPSSSVTLSDAAGASPTFSVFIQASGSIPFAPAASRVFVRFKDPAGGLHGSTSVAVETN